MLNADEQKELRLLATKHKLGMPTFLPNGNIRFLCNEPIKEKIREHLRDYYITDVKEGPTMDDRPDDMKWYYRVEVVPNFTRD